MKKIAFVGTSCTGKSTLCRSFSLDASVAIVPEAARDYFAQHPIPAALRFSFAVQGAIQRRIVNSEAEAERLGQENKILCDRSVLDPAVYTLFGGNPSGSQLLLSHARRFLSSYSRIVVLDPDDIPYTQDQIRTENADDRMTVHYLFLECFTRWSIDFSVLSGTADERANQVMLWLSE